MAANSDLIRGLVVLLIKKNNIGEALAFAEENAVALQAAIAGNQYFLTTFLKSLAECTWQASPLKQLWEEGDIEAGNYLQWLPEEVLEETMDPLALRLFELLMEWGKRANRDETIKADAQDGHHIMHAAVDHNNPLMVKALLEWGVNVDVRGSEKGTPLHTAVISNNESMVRFLLARKADINASNISLETPLLVAVQGDNLSMVRLLLEHGAEVNKSNHYGMSPLHWAVLKGNVEMVRLLLAYGADATMRNRMEKCASDYTDNPQIKDLLSRDPGIHSNSNNDSSRSQDMGSNPTNDSSRNQSISSNQNLVYRTLNRSNSNKPNPKQPPSDDKRPGLGG